MPADPAPRIGLLWRVATDEPTPSPAESRFRDIFAEFTDRGIVAEAVPFRDATVEASRRRLLDLDAVLVWVDPIAHGEDRTVLDALLRDVASTGVYVSAHPDAIVKIGTKEILHRTRDLPFGTDTAVYRSLDELLKGMPGHLRAGARVIKQDRGSSGNGVWRVSLAPGAPREATEDPATMVLVQSAERGATVRAMTLDAFAAERSSYFRYFAGRGTFVDQPYLERVSEGMIRCYLVHDQVVGFGIQHVTALTAPPPGTDGPPDPAPRQYSGPDYPPTQPLRRLLEGGWVEALAAAAGLKEAELPVIWDADFLLGPQGADGLDTYLLCEVNVSGVFPIPREAIAPLVDATIARVRALGRRA